MKIYKQILASPELPEKRNKYLKSIINLEIYMPVNELHCDMCEITNPTREYLMTHKKHDIPQQAAKLV